MKVQPAIIIFSIVGTLAWCGYLAHLQYECGPARSVVRTLRGWQCVEAVTP